MKEAKVRVWRRSRGAAAAAAINLTPRGYRPSARHPPPVSRCWSSPPLRTPQPSSTPRVPPTTTAAVSQPPTSSAPSRACRKCRATAGSAASTTSGPPRRPRRRQRRRAGPRRLPPRASWGRPWRRLGVDGQPAVARPGRFVDVHHWARGQGASESGGHLEQGLCRRVAEGKERECELCGCLGGCVPPAARPAAKPAEG